MPRLLERTDIAYHRMSAREISLRDTAIGGPVRNRAWMFPPKLLERGRNLLLMIHGFNVTLCEAGCAFEKFEQNLNLRWRARAVSLYWPGDTQNIFASSRVKRGLATKGWAALNYPRQIKRAQQSASVLLNGFRQTVPLRSIAQPPLNLTIVAHSMGCRLTLEFLQLLEATRLRISVPLVVLMAAAVPRYLVRQGAPLARAIRLPDRVIVHKSKADVVLAGAFRPGQLLEWSRWHGLNLSARAAIGRQGCGANAPGNVHEILGERGHSDYWPDEAIAGGVIDHLDGAQASAAVFRPLELRQRISGRSMAFQVTDGRRLSSRPVGRRGLRRVCKSC